MEKVKFLFVRLVFFSGIYCLMGCSSYSHNDAGPIIADDFYAVCQESMQQQLIEIVNHEVNQNQIPGIAIAFQLHGGEVVFLNHGYTQSVGSQKISEHSFFAIGSITKGFTAEYMAMLVQNGLFEWSDKLSELDLDVELSADAKNITLEQLVSHTSGLPRQVNDRLMLFDLARYILTGKQFYNRLDSGRDFQYLSEFKKEKDDVIRYSNLGYSILDKVITRWTGMSVDAGIDLHLLKTLRMTETTFNPESNKLYAVRAIGHAGDQPKFVSRGSQVPEWKFHNYMIGAASLWSTSADLIHYAIAHYDDKTPHKIKHAFDDSLKIRRVGGNEFNAALGWQVEDVRGHRFFYQSGFIAGYSSYIAVDPVGKNAIVVLKNSFNWSNGIGHKMMYRMALKNKYKCD